MKKAVALVAVMSVASVCASDGHGAPIDMEIVRFEHDGVAFEVRSSEQGKVMFKDGEKLGKVTLQVQHQFTAGIATVYQVAGLQDLLVKIEKSSSN